ncbi:MAG: hypothetical protein AB7E77_08395 [Desulfobulbus sp.]
MKKNKKNTQEQLVITDKHGFSAIGQPVTSIVQRTEKNVKRKSGARQCPVDCKGGGGCLSAKRSVELYDLTGKNQG